MAKDKNIDRAGKLAKEGLISEAVRTLDTRPPAPATMETFTQLQELHPQPTEPVRSAIPHGSPRNTFVPSDRAIASAVRHAPNKVKAGTNQLVIRNVQVSHVLGYNGRYLSL